MCVWLRLCAIEFCGDICRNDNGYVFCQRAVFVRHISIATWCEELWNFRFRIRFNSESIQGVVMQAVFRMFAVNDDGNRNYPYLDNDGKRWNGNWNWIDNDFNRNGRVASNWW
ncbi:MAG: hypothetical protein AAB602_02075 [Patescibacteria group bacterium]